jgi:hypothetical protein
LPGFPRLSSFDPNTGAVGTTVTITGLNLDHATAVSFNGMAAPFTVVSSTMVTATVPPGATTGKVRVTTPAGTATSATNFTVTIVGGPSYVTLQFGRTQWVGTQDCVPLACMVDLGTIANELQSRGYAGVGAVVLDSTSDGSRQCIGRFYQSASWQDIASLQAMGWSFVSAGRSYVDLTQLTPDLQYADSCGSLPDFAARGIDASGEFAYPDNHSTTGLQTDIVSTCFDWGRLYQAVGVNTLAGSVAPWFQVSHSLTGGLCNDPTRACYLKAAGATQRYQLPARLGAWLSGLKPDQWAVLQGYRFVSGSQLTAWPTWDCTSADTKAHWTSQGELYCWNDYLAIIGRIQPGTIVTDPHSVAVAWGR